MGDFFLTGRFVQPNPVSILTAQFPSTRYQLSARRHRPEYAELAGPSPLTLTETQDLLGPDEALVTYAVWHEITFLWVIRHDDMAFHRLDIGRQDLDDAVTFVRAGLDQSGVGSLGDIRRFDVDEAVALYQQIFAPAEPMLEGARHVFVVPDGALQSLPLGVLVTEEPDGPVRKFSAYRDVEWLAKKYAMTVLPSVSSLRALRRFAKAALASRPFVGFGDPVLKGGPAGGRGIDVATLFTRGAVADVEAVRDLARLPDTADELIRPCPPEAPQLGSPGRGAVQARADDRRHWRERNPYTAAD